MATSPILNSLDRLKIQKQYKAKQNKSETNKSVAHKTTENSICKPKGERNGPRK